MKLLIALFCASYFIVIELGELVPMENERQMKTIMREREREKVGGSERCYISGEGDIYDIGSL
jgi:hypothetical protein